MDNFYFMLSVVFIRYLDISGNGSHTVIYNERVYRNIDLG